MADPLNDLIEALRKDPENIDLLLQIGQQANLLKNPQAAAVAYQKLLDLQIHPQAAKLGLAQSLLDMGKLSEAAVRYEHLLTQHPHNAVILSRLAHIALLEGNTETAYQHWQHCLQSDPNFQYHSLEKALGRPSPQDQHPQAQHPDAPAAGEESYPIFSNDSDSDDDDQDPRYHLSDFPTPRVRHADIYGHQNLLKTLHQRLGTLSPSVLSILNHQPQGGVLLVGSPGSGKSHIAQALAGQAKVPLLRLPPHRLHDTYVGGPEQNLHQLFALANREGPCVLLLENLDTLIKPTPSYQTNPILDQLHHELDHLAPESGSLVIATSHAPWHIPASLIRGGRLSSQHHITPPKSQSRAQLLRDEIPLLAPDFLLLDHLKALVHASKGQHISDIRHSLIRWHQSTDPSPQQLLRELQTHPKSHLHWLEQSLQQLEAIPPHQRQHWQNLIKE